jgi:hypothetical protein
MAQILAPFAPLAAPVVAVSRTLTFVEADLSLRVCGAHVTFAAILYPRGKFHMPETEAVCHFCAKDAEKAWENFPYAHGRIREEFDRSLVWAAFPDSLSSAEVMAEFGKVWDTGETRCHHAYDCGQMYGDTAKLRHTPRGWVVTKAFWRNC